MFITSEAIVLLIPFLPSFLAHNHILPSYLLQHLVDIAEVFDLQEVLRILFMLVNQKKI